MLILLRRSCIKGRLYLRSENRSEPRERSLKSISGKLDSRCDGSCVYRVATRLEMEIFLTMPALPSHRQRNQFKMQSSNFKFKIYAGIEKKKLKECSRGVTACFSPAFPSFPAPGVRTPTCSSSFHMRSLGAEIRSEHQNTILKACPVTAPSVLFSPFRKGYIF